MQQATAQEDFSIRMLGALASNLSLPLLRAPVDRAPAAQILRWRAYNHGYNYHDHLEEKTLEEAGHLPTWCTTYMI